MEEDLKKLEFMAAIKLVPPAVLEEIHRRQDLCRAELGNWWEREHGKDFCLVLRDTTNNPHQESQKNIDKNMFNGETLETIEIREMPPDYTTEISPQNHQIYTGFVNQLQPDSNNTQIFNTHS